MAELKFHHWKADMNLSDDNRLARIAINRDLTAVELEALIVRLMTLRSKMLPEVPAAPPDPEAILSCQEDGGFGLRTLKDGRTHLLLRHAGAGWLAFTLGIEHAGILRDYLVANTSDDQPVRLISEDVGSGNLPQ